VAVAVAVVGGATFSEAAVRASSRQTLAYQGSCRRGADGGAAPAAAPAVGAGSTSGSVASEASARGQDRPLHAPLTRCEGTTGAPQLARRHNAIVGHPLALTSSLPPSLPPSAVRGSSRRAGVAVASQLVGCREEFFLIRVCSWEGFFSSAGGSGPSGYNDGYTGYG
jgi:hypothetical protein